MLTCILAVGILLTGQIGDSSGTRYPPLGQSAPPTGGTAELATPPVGQQPRVAPSDNGPPAARNRLRSPLPPATSPRTSPRTPPPASTAPSSRLTKVTRSTVLLRSLTKPVGKEKLVGKPISLAEAVQNTRSRAKQTDRVKRYWELSEVVTNYYLASLEELELQSLRDDLSQAGQAWRSAQQAVAARKQVAHSAVKVAQFRLHKELGRGVASPLPLPSDLPHCGAYETKYAQIFRGRNLREAEQLSELLSLRHQGLGQRAADATAAREWLVLVSQQRSPQSDGTQLLKAYEHLVLQRQTFVSTAYRYNANIARYTELAVPQEIGTGRLVAMLIQSDGNLGGDWQPGAIEQATAEEELPKSNAGRYPPRTFAEPSRNETRRVPAGEARDERSILVLPQEPQAINGL